jgi:hypothetical protein
VCTAVLRRSVGDDKAAPIFVRQPCYGTTAAPIDRIAAAQERDIGCSAETVDAPKP